MAYLFIHPDAREDLKLLMGSDPTSAGRIAALLVELKDDERLLDSLTDHDYGYDHSEPFHISKWVEQWRKGNDLWRLKIWQLEDCGVRYRIVYAYLPVLGQYHVLAIAPREFNYDENHPISQRILRAYKDLY